MIGWLRRKPAAPPPRPYEPWEEKSPAEIARILGERLRQSAAETDALARGMLTAILKPLPPATPAAQILGVFAALTVQATDALIEEADRPYALDCLATALRDVATERDTDLLFAPRDRTLREIIASPTLCRPGDGAGSSVAVRASPADDA